MAYDLRSRVTFQLGKTGTGRLHWRFASSDCRPPGDRAPGVLVPQNGLPGDRDHPSTTRWPGAQRLGNLLCAVGGPMTCPSENVVSSWRSSTTEACSTFAISG